MIHRNLRAAGCEVTIDLDEKGRITDVLGDIHALLGVCQHEVTGRSVFSFVHPDDRALWRTNLADSLVLLGLAARDFARLTHKSGDAVLVDAMVMALRTRPRVVVAQLVLRELAGQAGAGQRQRCEPLQLAQHEDSQIIH